LVEGVRGRRRRRPVGRARDEPVRPSPPLTKTDPMAHYLAGEMVPCPVGCGGFSEVVHVSTMPNGAGEVWFECLSCAQRKSYRVARATPDEIARVMESADSGEPICVRCSRNAILRRRGRQLVCPDCGVIYGDA
jgi:hypothetical protein